MSSPFLGEIRIFGGNFAPYGWLMCEGQIMPISQYSALFSLLGTQFGGNGTTNFQLPDLRGRMPIGQGQSTSGTDYEMGEQTGTETVTLTANQIASHGHGTQGVASQGNASTPGGHSLAASSVDQYSTAAPTVAMATNAIGSAGGNQPHNNLPPYLCVTFIIATQGVFPTRG